MKSEKFYFLETKKDSPAKNECVWQSKPQLFSFILNCEFLETIVFLCIVWYFRFSFFIFTDILLFLYIVKWGISIYQYVTTQYFITKTHFVLRRGNKYYYYPIEQLDKDDFKIHFNIFDSIFKCKTMTYAYCKVSDVPQGNWVVLHRNSTGSSNAWYKKAKFSHVKDYHIIYRYMNNAKESVS